VLIKQLMQAKGRHKRIQVSNLGTARDLMQIFFIYKRKKQPCSGHQLLIESRALRLYCFVIAFSHYPQNTNIFP
jgi:hypothetical protein